MKSTHNDVSAEWSIIRDTKSKQQEYIYNFFFQNINTFLIFRLIIILPRNYVGHRKQFTNLYIGSGNILCFNNDGFGPAFALANMHKVFGVYVRDFNYTKCKVPVCLTNR